MDLAGARRDYLSGNYDKAEKALRALAGGDSPKARSSGARSTLARLLLETGRTKEAAEVASKLREESPKDARWAVLAGELALAAGKVREAEDSFVEALTLDPEGRRARIFLKRIYDLTGRDKESRRIVDYFWDFNNEKLAGGGSPDPADFMYVAEAVREYDAEAKKVAFRHFRRAYAGDPNIPAYEPDPDLHEAYIGAGELALEVYDWPRAQREFGALLKRNPHHPVAHLGLARLHLAASDNKKAEEEAKKALEANPKLIGAHLVLAQLHMVDDRMDEARREIDAALGANPVDPDAMAMDATWRFASGDEAGFESIAKRALALYPRHVGLYAGAASVLERRRRFPEALAQHRKVAELDPDGWEGHYGVGMTLVRMGEERAGYKSLETAFERNPFNVWAYNTLVALDRDFKEGALVRRETEHWVIKLTKEEEPVLAEQVEELLEELWDEETKRFGFAPRGPDETKRKVLFEMFAEHEDFSSRTAGIPNLGALGATLGQIVTMPSPSWGAGEGKPFCWTEVVRHEFVHVITLQMTGYRIPRWFTEGISVHVEADPQTAWDGLLARAVNEDDLAPLSKLNSRFTRPESPAQVALGYYQASLVVDYLVERHGFDAIMKACELFRRGKGSEEVMRSITRTEPAELDRRIARHVKEHIERIGAWAPPGMKEIKRLKERLESHPTDAKARARFAEGLVASRQYDDARKEAEKAITDSGGKGPAAAHVTVGLVATITGRDLVAARAAFEKAVAADGRDFFARLYLGLARWRSGDEKEAAEALLRAHEINPRFVRPVNAFRSPPLPRLLLDLLEKQGPADRRLEVAERAVKADPRDWQSALLAGSIHSKAGRTDKAMKWLAQALSVNPFHAETQLLYAKTCEALAGDGSKAKRLAHAARGYRATTALTPRDVEGYRGLARTLWALGRKEEARAAVETLRQFDPAAVEELQKSLK